MKKGIIILFLCCSCGCFFKSQEQKEAEELFHIQKGYTPESDLFLKDDEIYCQKNGVIQKGEVVIDQKKFSFSDTGEYLDEDFDNLNILFVDKELSHNWIYLYEMFEKECDVEYLASADFDVNDYDALVLGGGYDVDPSFYGEKNKGSQDVDHEEDELQFAAIEKFVKAKKPILGICRGEQLLNVYFGGSLYQDIPDHMGKYHKLSVKRNSLFAEILKTGDNGFCSHHQSIHRLGKNLVVTERAKSDRHIEAIEHTYLPIYGSQWHPEEMEDGQDLIKVFLEEVNRNRLILAMRQG